MGNPLDANKDLSRQLETLQTRARELEDADRERQRQTEAIRETERRYRAIIETQSEFITRHKEGGVLTFVNDALCQYLGQESDNLIGRSFLDFLPEEDRGKVIDHLASLGTNNPVDIIEHHTVLPGGEVRWHQWENHAIFDDDGLLIEIQSVGRDITDRRTAEAEVARAKDQIDHLLRSCPAVVYSCGPGPEYATTFISENVSGLFGYEVKQFLDDPHFWEKRIHPEDVERVLHELSQVEVGVPLSYEYRFRHANGRYIWLHDQLMPSGAPDGSVSGLSGSWFDVTSRKKTEESLQLLSSTVEQSTEGLAVVDLGGHLLFVNRAFAEMHGYTREEIAGKHLSVFHTADQMPAVNAANKQLKDTGKFSGEIWHARKDGTVFPALMHNSFLHDDRGDPIGMIGTLRDITDRHRTETALRESEERFRAITGNMPGAVFSYDVDTEHRRTLVYVGPGFENLIGQAATDRLRGGDVDHFFNLVHPDDLRKMYSAGRFEAAFEGSVDEEYRVGSDVDGYTWVRSIAQPTRLNNTTLRWHGVMIDITARKRAEHALRDSEAKLRHAHKLQAVGQLAAGVAHDFNSTLTVILGNAELLSGKLAGIPSKSMREVCASQLSQITHAVQSGQSLVRKLLTFGRAQKWNPNPLDCSKVVAETKPMVESILGESIHVEVRSGANLRLFEGDAAQMEQVIMNLALNARDAMPRGGDLVIETADVDVDESHALLHPEATSGPHVMIAISDTGSGIEKENLDRIFEPFFSTKPIDKGSGLGLSIVHGIVRQASGHITVESELGNGTIFRLYFPAIE